MSGSTNPTDGMFYSKDGSYTGQVAISANKVDLEAGDYTNYDSSTDKLKQKAVNLGELSEAGATNLLTATNISNQLKALEVEATLKSAEIIQNSNITLAKAITNSALGIKASMNEASLQTDGMMTMQGEIYLQLDNLNKNIIAQTKAISEQQLQLNADSISMDNVALDTAPIVQALNEGVQNQITTNAKIVENLQKKNDHLDYLKNGDSGLKDSRGNVIKPREVQAKNHAEHQIYKTSENTFDWKSSLVEIYTDLESNFDPSNLGFGTEGDNLLTLLTKLVTFDPDKFETDESKIFGKAKT